MKEQFNKDAKACIDALNRLLQCEYVSKNERYMMRINRFKRWVIDFIDKEQPASINN